MFGAKHVALSTMVLVLSSILIYTYITSKNPENESLPNQVKNYTRVIPIGVFSSNNGDYPTYKFLSDLATKDFNAYCNLTGISASMNVTLGNAEGHPVKALEFTQLCNRIGIKLIVGFGWSSYFCSGAYGYANRTGQVLLSPSSSSPTYNMKDHVFRLCSDDVGLQSKLLTRIMSNRGVQSLIVIRRGDSWADAFFEEMKIDCEKLGCSIVYDMRCAAESTQFEDYMKMTQPIMDDVIRIHGKKNVAVLLIAYDETTDILRAAEKYPPMLNVTWYGTDGTAKLPSATEQAPAAAMKAVLISCQPSKIKNDVLARINRLWVGSEEYKKQGVSGEFSFYEANIYDCIMVAALSALRTETIDVEALKTAIPVVAEEFDGASGTIHLNENGDRTGLDYDIYGYFDIEGMCEATICGRYNASTDDIIWDFKLMPP